MAKLDRLGWVVTDWFELEGFQFGVRSTSHVFSSWLRETLAAYHIDGPEDPDDFPIYAVVVEDGENDTGRKATHKFHIIYYGTWDIVRTLDVATLARSLLHEIGAFLYPTRDDAVFVEASVMRLNGQTILIPALFVKPLCGIGRRLTSSLDITLPGVMSVALDPETGHLLPPPETLELTPDWGARLLEAFPAAGGDARAIVSHDTKVDKVVAWVQEPMPTLRPCTSRGRVLLDYAGMVRNRANVAGGGLTALGRLMADAEVVELQYFSWRHAVDVLGALGDGREYVWDRTEATPAVASDAQDPHLESVD